MRSNPKKINLAKILILTLSFNLLLLMGIGIFNTKSIGQNLNNNLILSNNLKLANTRAVELDNYIKNASLIANNSTIKIDLNVSLPWNGGVVKLTLDKSRIDKFRNNSDTRIYQNSNGYEYFNININSNSPTTDVPGKYLQYINLISNGKYIWESGFSPQFDLMKQIISKVISEPNLDITKNLYLNFRQEGNGEFVKKLTRRVDGVIVHWYVTNEYATLPKNGSLIFESENIFFGSNKSTTSNLECYETKQDKNNTTQTIKSNTGISFSLNINPMEAKVSSPDIGECTLYQYLSWIRDLWNNYMTTTVNYGSRVTASDAILIDRNEGIENLASQFSNVNTLDIYKNSINNHLNRNGNSSKIWNVSRVYDLYDSSLDPNVSSLVNQLVTSNKLSQFDDKTGVFYKVIKLDNAFYLGKNARTKPNVPWLYYVCDVANEPLASYYIVKFETILKMHSILDLKYDFSLRKFYLETKGADFINLKQQYPNWPSQIYLTYDSKQWINRFENALNSSSLATLVLDFSNDQNIPFKFDLKDKVVSSDLYNGFVDFFAANGIDLNNYGITSANDIAAIINDDSIAFNLNYKVNNIVGPTDGNVVDGVNNVATMSSNVVTTSVLGTLIGIALIGAIIGGVFALTNKNKSIKKNIIVSPNATTPVVAKPKKPIRPPRKAHLIVLDKQSLSSSGINKPTYPIPMPQSVACSQENKSEFGLKIASKFKKNKNKPNLKLEKKQVKAAAKIKKNKKKSNLKNSKLFKFSKEKN